MTPHKRQKVYRKRTPWKRHRFSAFARLAQRAMRVAAIAQGMSRVRGLCASSIPKSEKALAIAEALTSTQAAVVKIPLPGAKTP